MKLTKEEIKELWEHFIADDQVCIVESSGATHFETLPVDLNSLFKYAPKDDFVSVHFSYGDEGVLCWIYTKKEIGKPFYGKGLTEEDALARAILEAIKEMK